MRGMPGLAQELMVPKMNSPALCWQLVGNLVKLVSQLWYTSWAHYSYSGTGQIENDLFTLNATDKIMLHCHLQCILILGPLYANTGCPSEQFMFMFDSQQLLSHVPSLPLASAFSRTYHDTFICLGLSQTTRSLDHAMTGVENSGLLAV